MSHLSSVLPATPKELAKYARGKTLGARGVHVFAPTAPLAVARSV